MEPNTPSSNDPNEVVGGIHDSSVNAISVTSEGRIEIPSHEPPKEKVPEPASVPESLPTAEPAQTSTPEPSPVPPAAEPEEKKDTYQSPLKQIRTFEGDVAEAIQKKNESLISIQEKQVKKQGNVVSTKEPSPRGSRSLVMAFFTIFFIAVGSYGAYYAWTRYQTQVVVPVVSTPPNQFLMADSITDIDGSTLGRESLLATIATTKSKLRGGSSVEQIQLHYGGDPTSDLMTTSDFLFRLASHAPAPLVRAFDKSFMLGVMGSPSHTFLIVKLTSFENAFPGMLEWEPLMAEDIWPLVASESVIDSIPSQPQFDDVVIENRDARILKDNSGRTALLYSFYDNNYLIITDNETTFRTIIQRLDSQKLSR